MDYTTVVLQPRALGVVTSIHFVKIKTKSLKKFPGFEPKQASPSRIFNPMPCELSYQEIRSEQLLINPPMTDFNYVRSFVVILLYSDVKYH